MLLITGFPSGDFTTALLADDMPDRFLQLKMLQFAVTAPFCLMTAGEMQLKIYGVGIIVECDNSAVPAIGRSHTRFCF